RLRRAADRRGALHSAGRLPLPGAPRERSEGPSMSLLAVEGLSKRFGGLQAVRDLSFVLDRGEVLGLIGPNGAGKTTVFHMLSGFVTPDAGTIRFDGVDIVGWKPHAVCRAGLVRTFQIARPFPHLSVLGNV